jgi:c-di-GMP-related signal transduction protein
MDIFIARQPIFDRLNNVYAYELLYRTGEVNSFDQSVTDNVATSILLMNSHFNFGIEHLVGKSKAFINFDLHLIKADIPRLLNKDNVVIELLETIVPDRSFIRKIKELKALGYTIAIDDFVEGYEYEEVINICDIIKVDFFGNTEEQIKAICKKYKAQGKLMLAEKVETLEVYEWAKKIGFDLFQGYFFSKPAIVKSKGMHDNAIQYIKLIEELAAPEPDYKRISRIIEVDITLTYKLLKLVNSSYSLVTNIESITHALSILGIKSFEKWLSLATVQNLGSEKPSEIVKISMIRSHFLEAIALKSHLKKHASDLSLIGILSVIDVLLEKPMESIVLDLPLSDNIKRSLLLEDNTYSPILQIAFAYEKGDFHLLESPCSSINYDIKQLSKDYAHAVIWAEDLFKYMSEEL